MMMNTSLPAYERKSDLAQVFTPLPLARYMTDLLLAGMTDQQKLEATYLEPSAGAGDLLLPLLDALTQASQREGNTFEDTATIISRQLHLIEYDPDAAILLRRNLTQHAAHLNLHIPEDTWKLHVGDALDYTPANPIDRIIGNPPYIRLHDMPAKMREKVKAFSLGTGTTDLYVIFFQLGYSWLAPAGRLVYVTPNSFLKNVAQRAFRQNMFQNGALEHVTDYRDSKVFPDADTYIAVTSLTKNLNHNRYTFQLGTASGTPEGTQNILPYPAEQDQQNPVTLLTPTEQAIYNTVATRGRSLTETAIIGNGVATLRDKLFLHTTSDMENEPALLPVVKGSTYKGTPRTDTIIFPYQLDETGKAQPLEEAAFAANNPNIYQHLLDNKEELLTRDLDRNASWFQYGRSQGLAHVGVPKIVVAPLVAPGQTQLNAHIITEPAVIYSGIYLALKEDSPLTLEELYKIIRHPDLATWVRLVGKDMSGGYRSFGTKALQTYRH